MKTCETCAYWEQEDDKFTRERYPDMGDCNSEKFEYGGDNLPDGLTYGDYEGFAAWFRTGRHFGCIHHKEKK